MHVCSLMIYVFAYVKDVMQGPPTFDLCEENTKLSFDPGNEVNCHFEFSNMWPPCVSIFCSRSKFSFVQVLLWFYVFTLVMLE